MTPSRLLIAASGTGGHLFPALAVAEVLPDYQIEWLGVPDRLEARLVGDRYPLHTVSVGGFQSRSPLSMGKTLYGLGRSVFHIRHLLKEKGFAGVFYWELYQNEKDSFNAILDPKVLQRNWKIYTINNEIAIDFVGKFENLATDLKQVCDRVGLDWDGWLPRAKAKVRHDRRPYQEVLTAEQAAIIAEYAAREIETFGYTY